MPIRGGSSMASSIPVPPDDDDIIQTEEEIQEGKVVYAFLKAAAGDSRILILYPINDPTL